MIDFVEFSYFESYQNAYIQFCSGVNVITGTSDSGKSGILRAIRLIIEGKPVGDKYVSDFKKGKQFTAVTIGFSEGTTVTREKKRGVNQYVINGDKDNPLKAIRTDVPEEVKAITRMSSVNIQSQHDPYFLLNKTSGQVAKEFNKLANLTLVDNLRTVSNTYITDLTSKKEVAEETAKNLGKAIKSLKWVKDAERDLQIIKTLETVMVKLKIKRDYFEETQTRIYDIQHERNLIPNYEGALEIIDTLISINDELKKYENKNHNLSTWQGRIETTKIEIEEEKTKSTKLKKEYKQLLSKAKKCPFCGAKT